MKKKPDFCILAVIVALILTTIGSIFLDLAMLRERLLGKEAGQEAIEAGREVEEIWE